MPSTVHRHDLAARCHRVPCGAPQVAMTLMFDDDAQERAVVHQLSRAYGAGRELATARCRQRVWETGGREVSLSAADGRLELCVARAA